jgi:hypothetical protein
MQQTDLSRQLKRTAVRLSGFETIARSPNSLKPGVTIGSLLVEVPPDGADAATINMPRSSTSLR